MKLRSFVFAFLLFVWCAGADAQQKRELRGKVFSLGENGEDIPEKVIVTLEETGGSDDTNDLGLFFIALPARLKAGDEVTMVVNKPGWRVRNKKTPIPADLNRTVEVELLPNDSKLFWTHGRIEKFIRDLAGKTAQQAPAKDEAEKIDFGRYIKEWAVQYGFSAEQAKEEIDQWIADIEAKSNDLTKLGLAAFAKRNFPEAAKNFEAAFAQDSTQLATVKKQRQALEEKEKQLTAQAVENARLAGDSYYNDNRFDKALAAYQRAQQLVDKTKAPQQWANLALVMGNANRALGIRTEGEKIQAYLSAAQQAYQQAAEVWPRDREPEGWAMTQNNLGNVYRNLGTRTGGEEGAKLLKASVTAYENALVVRTREQLPQDWAGTQNNLGIVYRNLGTRTGGEEGAKWLKAAVTAYENALVVRTREQLPQDWAMTQNNLGAVYTDLGTRTGGEEGAKWLRASVTAYENALVVYTREQLPQDWAMAQNNLGAVLSDLGTRTGGEEGAKLLRASVTAYENALVVRTREQLPQQWAGTQNNLGTVYRDLGTRTGGEEGAKLLKASVTAYENALVVYTREQLPQDWAMTQNNLGNVYNDLGMRTGGEEGAKWLRASVTAYENALVMRTRKQLPQDWAMTQNNLGIVCRNLGTRTSGEEGAKWLRAAVTALKASLEVRSFEYLPVHWAQSQNNLAETYTLLEDWPNVALCYANVLKVYPDYEKAYQEAVRLYHEVVFGFAKAFELNQQWLKHHPNDLLEQIKFVEKHFTTGRFPECELQTKRFIDSRDYSAQVQIVMCMLNISTNLALKTPIQVSATIDSLISNISRQPESFKLKWSFEGTKHFISQNEKLAPHRAWLLQLFQALEIKEGREAILAALQEARKNFRL